jgi:hypothetical protein
MCWQPGWQPARRLATAAGRCKNEGGGPIHNRPQLAKLPPQDAGRQSGPLARAYGVSRAGQRDSSKTDWTGHAL